MVEVKPTGEKVWHTLVRAGLSIGHVATDLAYIDGVPTLVFWWRDDRPAPDSTVALDPQYLHEINWPQAKYLYQFAIDDPRATSQIE